MEKKTENKNDIRRNWTSTEEMHGGKVTGSVCSTQYFPSPIATRGLVIMFNCEFKIDASKLNLLERFKYIIEKKYKDRVQSSVDPIRLDNLNISPGRWR